MKASSEPAYGTTQKNLREDVSVVISVKIRLMASGDGPVGLGVGSTTGVAVGAAVGAWVGQFTLSSKKGDVVVTVHAASTQFMPLGVQVKSGVDGHGGVGDNVGTAVGSGESGPQHSIVLPSMAVLHSVFSHTAERVKRQHSENWRPHTSALRASLL